MWLTRSKAQARPEEKARSLVEEAGHELEAIKQALAALDKPQPRAPSPQPEASRAAASKPVAAKETLASRIALAEAS